MKVQAVTIDLVALGALIANEDSKVQSEFFRGLARELALQKSRYNTQLQWAYVATELTKEERNELRDVLPMLWEEARG
jgi:hypothetical protein